MRAGGQNFGFPLEGEGVERMVGGRGSVRGEGGGEEGEGRDGEQNFGFPLQEEGGERMGLQGGRGKGRRREGEERRGEGEGGEEAEAKRRRGW